MRPAHWSGAPLRSIVLVGICHVMRLTDCRVTSPGLRRISEVQTWPPGLATDTVHLPAGASAPPAMARVGSTLSPSTFNVLPEGASRMERREVHGAQLMPALRTTATLPLTD